MSVDDLTLSYTDVQPLPIPRLLEPRQGECVGIVGLGYVGLPTAIAFADAGRPVIGCDISRHRMTEIVEGRADLLEIDRSRLTHHLRNETLRLTSTADALERVGLVIVCVPTPIDPHLSPDLTALRSACADVVRHAVAGQTIVLTSTSYVGSTRELIVEPLAARGLLAGVDVSVAFSPERIDPGNAVHRQDTVPRIVGGVTQECAERAATVLRLVAPEVHVVSSPEAAEAAKLLENTFRAVNIAFVNEFADACGELDLDIMEVIAAAATKPYGFMPFYPGPGVGGHCVPCDPHYLLWQLRARRTRLPLTESAMNAIAIRPRQAATRVKNVLLESGRRVRDARVLVVGLTYKPGVRDVRESPALEVIRELDAAGVDVAFHDPLIERVRLDGRELCGIADPSETTWDLAVVHTLQPGIDYAWLNRCPHLLDLTYRASHLTQRETL